MGKKVKRETFENQSESFYKIVVPTGLIKKIIKIHSKTNFVKQIFS